MKNSTKRMSRMGMACAALAAGCGSALAQESTFIDLTGVQLRDGSSQNRSSAGTISPSCYYDYAIDGMVRGTSGGLAVLYPTPTPLADVLESLSPGSSAFLAGRVVNPGGGHPVVFFNEPLSGTQVILGTTVTFSATFEVGIRADNTAYFSLTNVVLSPSFLVGAAQFTSGRADIVRVVCAVDFNCDGFVDFSDYLSFLNLFDAEDPAADLNQDGFVDFVDYLEFLNQFALGC